MLTDILKQYDGTLFVVSHDRDFLDQTVTKTLAFEGNAEVEGIIGGYSDYIAFKAAKEKEEATKAEKPKQKSNKQTSEAPEKKGNSNKLSYKYKLELEKLPSEIKKLEKEIADLQALLEDPDLYVNDADKFMKASTRLPEAQDALADKELRWLELEEMKEA